MNVPLYQAWLHFKFASRGTEHEAVEKTPFTKVQKDIPERKRKIN